MTDSFGLAAIHEDQRREKLEKAYHRGFVVTLSLVSLMAAASIGYHSKAPAAYSDYQTVTVKEGRSIDYAENCFVIRFVDEEGRERHKNTPALPLPLVD